MSTPETETLLANEEMELPVVEVGIVRGPDAGAKHVLSGSSVTVGSGELCTIRLCDPKVSRLHCVLERRDSELRLRDLGSKNGCWLGGARVIEIVLAPSVEVRLGQSTLRAGIGSRRLRVPVFQGGGRFGALFGESPAMQRAFAAAARAAASEEPVLLRGESGTGKELFARAIHDASGRRGGPFVVIDGAALSSAIADLELFGHERGAFTGAHIERAGAFERAHGGTLFIDELGELSVDVQRRLLRVTEAGLVRRLGASLDRPADVRLIAATHAPLEQMVADGSFRQDLLYRLLVLEIRVPPLREREDDLRKLAAVFAAEVTSDPALLAAAEREVQSKISHPWPGNVRELRSFVRRVLLLGAQGEPESAYERPFRVGVEQPFSEARDAWLRSFERLYMGQLLDETRGSVRDAIARSGLGRSRFYEVLARTGLRAKTPDESE